jgi:8-oxo-dGTP pyrophosphatase MutT (NUDIX family)
LAPRRQRRGPPRRRRGTAAAPRAPRPRRRRAWAWTTPAGSRQPGEAILPGALRELAEEAGLVGVDPQPVDLTGHWALFTVEVAADARVTLVDREHDRYGWVPPGAANDRVKPAIVAGGIRRALPVPLDPVTFAPRVAPTSRACWPGRTLPTSSAGGRIRSR